MLSMAVISPAFAKTECKTELEESKNLLLNVVTIPFKVVMTFLHLPRCVIANFPVNEEKVDEKEKDNH